MDKTCVGCGRSFRADGHGQRWRQKRRYCSIECYRGRPSAPIVDRFWRYVAKGDGCWEWTGARGKGRGPYGYFAPDRDTIRLAHRVVWELTYGPIPDGLWVLHHCDNPPCVRPDHLFLGTNSDNQLDALHKGRRPMPAPMLGEANPNHKLTETQIRAIRASDETNVAQAARYGVSPPMISYIRSRKAWRHVA